MSKRIKSKAVVDSDSEGSEGETEVKKTAKAKKAKASASSSKEDDDNVFPIAPKRQVTVREFKGKIYVDIREFYEDSASGEMKPGRKGISLPVDQWEKLKGLVDDIDEAIGKMG